MTRHHSCRVSPFGHPRITARLTAPRGLSQPPTSFIGSQCQGIHHAPLNTYNTKQTKKNEKKESHYNKPHQPTLTKNHPPQRETAPPEPATSCGLMLATTIHKSNTTPHHQAGRQSEPPTNSQGPAPTTPKNPGASLRACCLRTQQCVQRPRPHVPVDQATPPKPGRASMFVVHPPESHYRTLAPLPTTRSHTIAGAGEPLRYRCSLERR